GDAAVDVQGAERDDECRDPGERHDGPVDQAEDRACRDGDQGDDGDRQVRRVEEQASGEGGGQAEHGTHGEVDVARDDDDRLPHGEHDEDRGREQQVAPPARAEQEARLDQGGHADDGEECEGDTGLATAQEAHAAPPSAGAPAPGAPGVAARMTASGVASARSSVAAMRPSRTTSTRSAMPSTSGSSDEIMRTASPSAASVD